jgi:hypothetical protein
MSASERHSPEYRESGELPPAADRELTQPDGPDELNTLLVSAPVNRHFAQLHRDTAALSESVCLFVEAGLRRRSGVVVIASEANTGVFLDKLRASEVDVAGARHSGQLRLFNAETLLQQFMRKDLPDWGRFKQTIEPILEGCREFGFGSLRAYGEMVNLLWSQGKEAAAIRLEEYWNELAGSYPFSLFCGYTVNAQRWETYSGRLHDIGRTHSHVLAGGDDEAFRKALEDASKDIFGVSLPDLIHSTGYEDKPGESRLPLAHRTMLWVHRNVPSSGNAVLERARSYYESRR